MWVSLTYFHRDMVEECYFLLFLFISTFMNLKAQIARIHGCLSLGSHLPSCCDVLELCDQLMPTCIGQRLYTAAEPGRDLARGAPRGVARSTPVAADLYYYYMGRDLGPR